MVTDASYIILNGNQNVNTRLEDIELNKVCNIGITNLNLVDLDLSKCYITLSNYIFNNFEYSYKKSNSGYDLSFVGYQNSNNYLLSSEISGATVYIYSYPSKNLILTNDTESDINGLSEIKQLDAFNAIDNKFLFLKSTGGIDNKFAYSISGSDDSSYSWLINNSVVKSSEYFNLNFNTTITLYSTIQSYILDLIYDNGIEIDDDIFDKVRFSVIQLFDLNYDSNYYYNILYNQDYITNYKYPINIDNFFNLYNLIDIGLTYTDISISDISLQSMYLSSISNILLDDISNNNILTSDFDISDIELDVFDLDNDENIENILSNIYNDLSENNYLIDISNTLISNFFYNNLIAVTVEINKEHKEDIEVFAENQNVNSDDINLTHNLALNDKRQKISRSVKQALTNKLQNITLDELSGNNTDLIVDVKSNQLILKSDDRLQQNIISSIDLSFTLYDDTQLYSKNPIFLLKGIFSTNNNFRKQIRLTLNDTDLSGKGIDWLVKDLLLI